MVSSGPSTLPANLPTGRARVAAIGATLIVLAACLVQIVRADRVCQKDFTYASDEAYVHLALARRIAMDPGGSGDSSPVVVMIRESASPAWTALLAGVARLSRPGSTPDEPTSYPWLPRLAPLIINLLMAGLLILLVGHALRFDVTRGMGMLMRLLVLAVVMPIPLLVLVGMEHLAHAFVLLLAVASSIELIERERLAARRLLFSMIWMALAVGLRYESLAALAGLFLWAWIRRRLGRMLPTTMVGLGVAIGLCVFLGLHGPTWLPEPVRAGLLNGDDDWSAWSWRTLDRAIGNVRDGLLPAVLVAIAAALLWSQREQQSSPDAEDRIRVGWLFVFAAAGVGHLLVGRVDDSYRYTAYLMPLGIVAVMRALARRPGAKWAPAAPVGLRYSVMAVFCLLPLAVAAVPVVKADWYAPQESRQVYVLNRMAASFVRTYFPQAVVASNQVGTLRYETAARVLDVTAADSLKSPLEAGSAQLALIVERAGASCVEPSTWGRRVGSWCMRGSKGPRTWFEARVVVLADPERERDVRIALRLFAEQQLGNGAVQFQGEHSATAPSEIAPTLRGDDPRDRTSR